MKKKILFKILLGILAVLLVASLAACGKKDPPKVDPGDGGDNKTEDPNLFKFSKLETLVDDAMWLVDEFLATEDQLSANLAIEVKLNDKEYQLLVAANLYATEAKYKDTVANIVLKEKGGDVILGVYYDGGDDALYIMETLTAKDTITRTLVPNIERLELSKLLGKIPTAIYDIKVNTKAKDTDPDNWVKLTKKHVTDAIDGILETLKFSGLMEPLLQNMGVLKFEISDTAAELKLVPESVGALIVELLGEGGMLEGAIPENFAGIIDTIANLIFGSTNGLAGLGDVTDFPAISINATMNSGKLTGISLSYKGDLDGNDVQDELVLSLKAEAFSAKTAISASTVQNLSGTTLTKSQYTEKVVKVSLDAVAAGKGLDLTVDAYLNPKFGLSSASDTNPNPTAYLVVTDNDSKASINVSALYDGEFLYFDLAGAFERLGVDATGMQTQYKIPFQIYDTTVAPSSADGDKAKPEEDIIGFTGDFMGAILGKMGTLFDMVKDTITNGELSISVPKILDLISGMVTIEEWDAEAKKHLAERAMKAADWITLIEDTLAGWSSLEDTADKKYTNAEKAADVIEAFTGYNVTVANLINATAGGNNELSLNAGLMKDALGLVLSILYNNPNGTKGEEVITLGLSISLVDMATFETGYTAAKAIDYSDALDLESEGLEGNVYYVDEAGTKYAEQNAENEYTKKFVVLDTLEDLLDAYKAYDKDAVED